MTGRASIRASCVALACWAWRSGYAAWVGASRSAPNRGAGPWSTRHCRWPNWTKGTDMKPIRILLADDHTVVRDGLRALLDRESDMTVVAEAADGRETVRLAEAE